jgi:hypothetical protein
MKALHSQFKIILFMEDILEELQPFDIVALIFMSTCQHHVGI